jgi:hypothetical protein
MEAIKNFWGIDAAASSPGKIAGTARIRKSHSDQVQGCTSKIAELKFERYQLKGHVHQSCSTGNIGSVHVAIYVCCDAWLARCCHQYFMQY